MATCYRHPDRETGLSCSNCGRPICAECMTHAAVGIRCPECAGRGAARPQRAAFQRSSTTPVLTYILIGANLLVFALTNKIGFSFSTADINHLGRELQITTPGIQDGQYWRLVSNAFMHYGLLHIGLNMYGLWILGGVLEPYVGTVRFGMIYLISTLTASLGALLINQGPSAGASGAIFGLMGALFVLERQRGMSLLAGPIGGLLVINLVITFGVPGISIGGHIGGLVGGVLVGLILSRFGKGHIAYSPLTPLITLAVLLVGVVAVVASLAVAG